MMNLILFNLIINHLLVIDSIRNKLGYLKYKNKIRTLKEIYKFCFHLKNQIPDREVRGDKK